MDWNSKFNVFKKIGFVGEISNKLPNSLFGTNVYKTLESYTWFLPLAIFFSVLPSSFILSSFKGSRIYPVLILNVILFSILFTYILTDGLSLLCPCFFKIYSK